MFKAINIILWASTKFLFAVGFTFAADFSVWLSLILLILGGMLGVLIFSYAGQLLDKLSQKLFPKKEDKLKINKFRRFIVKFRRGYGLAGIAFLTPVILTVPVGTIVANKMVKDKKKLFTYMFIAFTFWAGLFCGLDHLLGINLNFL